MLRGRIIAESLRPGSRLAVPSLTLTRVVREDVSGSTTTDQPDVWTLIDVEAPDDVADELAAALADVLASHGGWYADFRVGEDHVVVFAGKVFRYAVGDAAGRREAAAYGAAHGVPENQLDWDD